MSDTVLMALLPLPVALRQDAEVFTYDADWNRSVLRAGNNSLRCQAPGSASLPPGLAAQCFHESWEPSMVRISQLLASGMGMDESVDNLVADIHAGHLAGPNAGAVLYELFDQPGLQGHANMAVATPNATVASIGLPATPDAYRPWLMMAGTPMAHIMVQGK